MNHILKCAVLVIAALLVASCDLSQSKTDSSQETLSFSIREGAIDNIFYRKGEVSAHLLLTSGTTPRLIVGFPAGNSGVSLWMEEQAQPVNWQHKDPVKPISIYERGLALRGIETVVEARTDQLKLDEAVLGNIRHIRNRLHGADIPNILKPMVLRDGSNLTWMRERVDGQSAYHISLKVLRGEIEQNAQGLKIVADEGVIRLKVRALTGDKPLTPLPLNTILKNPPQDDITANMLAFLSYEEKLLAGSWRFLTYFGRDTLMSLALLMPSLQPDMVEAGLGAVLHRLSVTGEVAHEEDIAEFALFRNREISGIERLAPIYDYHMLDDNYMLAPVLAAYAFEHEDGLDRIDGFLDEIGPNGESHRAALARNMRYVLTRARAFAERPYLENLIHLRMNSIKGQWRDSDEGLAYGQIPYDINVVFVPAALEAMHRLTQANIIEGFDEAEAYAEIWRREAPKFFKQNVEIETAKAEITQYGDSLGVSTDDALASLQSLLSFEYDALVLKANGDPIPVMHSDGGFALLFSNPEASDVLRIVNTMTRPFPAGLLSGAGMMVSNPALADADVEALMTRGHYHGANIWSWQQALAIAGIKRQLGRSDLDESVKSTLLQAEATLWDAVNAGRELRNSELWSWKVEGGKIVPTPFAQAAGHKTESNAAQLWSTVFLGINQ